MTVILTPAEQRDLIVAGAPGPIYLTVEGEPSEAFPIDGLVAPSRFVEATGPCETCGGTHYGPRVIGHGCPDCIDGRKRAELRVIEGPFSYTHGALVLFAHATVEVLPVYDTDKRGPEHHAVVVAPSGVFRLDRNSSQHDYQLILVPLPVPGRDWIIIVDNVELTP